MYYYCLHMAELSEELLSELSSELLSELSSQSYLYINVITLLHCTDCRCNVLLLTAHGAVFIRDIIPVILEYQRHNITTRTDCRSNVLLLTAHGAVFIRVIITVIVSITEPRVTNTFVACWTLAVFTRTPTDSYDNISHNKYNIPSPSSSPR